jgi:hypothetical protein
MNMNVFKGCKRREWNKTVMFSTKELIDERKVTQ